MSYCLGRQICVAFACIALLLATAAIGAAQPRDLPPPPAGGMTPDVYAGMGAIVRQVTDPETGRQTVVVDSVLPGGPARQADVRAGDEIVELDGEPVESLSLREVVRKIRGVEGTELRLMIKREGVPEPLEVHITRAAMRPGTDMPGPGTDMPRPRLGDEIGPLMRMAQPPLPAMIAHEGYLFVLMGDVLYKIDAETLEQVGAVRLMPPPPPAPDF